VGSALAWQRGAVGAPKTPRSETQSETSQLAPIELEAMARASAIGTTEIEPLDEERATVEMVPLVALVDEEEPVKLARGSDAMPPRQERVVEGRRRRESLRVDQIIAKKPTEE
jgi:hypothetical protein